MDPQQPPPAQTPPPSYSPPPGYSPPPQSWQAPEPDTGPAPGVRFAGPGARLLAYIVDTILLSAVFILIFFLFTALAIGTASADGDVSGGAVGGFLLLILIAIVVSIAYFPWFWWKGGQTPGMKVFHIRVVRDADGGPISGGAALLRLLGYWVNSAVFYIGFIWIFVDKRRRGWHDLIAGTVVIEQ
ncbi:MAG: hypothetical protein A2V85_09105 [Chloroflexi bacterium RBG_16_72_14]|nr:MAG: hypothetical protein A2V85_09105 [Chloroflexi bacterium RBG_16_72_14]